MTSPLALAAADYLNRGLSVIALTGKTPNVTIHRQGLNSAIVGPVETEADWTLLAEAFDHKDTTGVGILTNHPYVVVDIDGPVGADEWLDIVGERYLIDGAMWVAKTGRGLHLWYATMQPTGTLKLGTKLDLKGHGGYVAAPPSQHFDDDGMPDHVYEWLLPPGDPPVEVPEKLAELIEDRAFDRAQAIAAKDTRQRAFGPRYQLGDTKFYAQANHDSLIANMAKAEEGNRNAYLHWAAATLSEEGGTEEEYERLAAIARKNGLEAEETRRTIRSARKLHA